jgi:hypothetical protein
MLEAMTKVSIGSQGSPVMSTTPPRGSRGKGTLHALEARLRIHVPRAPCKFQL